MRILFFILTFTISSALAGTVFDSHVKDATLRVDYCHSGDAETESITNNEPRRAA